MGLFSKKPKWPEPDLEFAADAYVQITITKRHSPHIDLYNLEQADAEALLSEGCTRNQAYSARWGGVLAIQAPLEEFDTALAAAKSTADEMGILYKDDKELYRKLYRQAAGVIIATLMVVEPKEYGRFLNYVNANI